MTLEFATLQAAVTSIVICSTCPPPMGGSRPSSQGDANLSSAASSNISRASSTVVRM
ncbi:MAG: hypothetical protein ACR2HP_13015 [Ilumatobacteraceae bacterium]